MRLINKKALIEHICKILEKDLVALRAAALDTYAAATGEESQPENQYDTRALEASYLAGAQSKRVLEIENSLTAYKLLELKDFNKDSPIASSALVELELKGKRSLVFLLSIGGGLNVQFESQAIQVITTKSPLGDALIGLKTGDVALVDKPAETLEYKILNVL